MPILSLVLFVAVVPLVYAPKTLPDKIVRKRFKEHLEKVQKVIKEEETPQEHIINYGVICCSISTEMLQRTYLA